jgi:PHP family Zn ribbon phosphoesterase
MTKEQFTEAFNMGRSYSNMPYGFNNTMKEHWKYKDSNEAFSLYNVVGQSEQLVCDMCGSYKLEECTKDEYACEDCGHFPITN